MISKCWKVNGKVVPITHAEFVSSYNNKLTGQEDWNECKRNLQEHGISYGKEGLYYKFTKITGETYYFTHKLSKVELEQFTISKNITIVKEIEIDPNNQHEKYNNIFKGYVKGEYDVDTIIKGEVGRLIKKHKDSDNQLFILLDGDAISITSDTLRLFILKGTKCWGCDCQGDKFIKFRAKNHNYYHLRLITNDGRFLTKDHILPVSKGGANELENYQVMCNVCNLQKGNNQSVRDIVFGMSTEDILKTKIRRVIELCENEKNSQISKNQLISYIFEELK